MPTVSKGRRSFRRWLREQPSGSLVGFAGTACNNVLACWLDETDAIQTEELFRIYVQSSVLRDGAWLRDLEDWEERFMHLQNDFPLGMPVTRELAEGWYKEAICQSADGHSARPQLSSVSAA